MHVVVLSEGYGGTSAYFITCLIVTPLPCCKLTLSSSSSETKGLTMDLGQCRKVWCSDGRIRTFRYHSSEGLKGYVRLNGTPIVGQLRPSSEATPYFDADPNGKNYSLLPNDIGAVLKVRLLEIVGLCKALGLPSIDAPTLAGLLGIEVETSKSIEVNSEDL